MKFPYRIVTEWSEADKCYIGRVPALPNLAVHGDTPGEAADEAEVVGTTMISMLGNEVPEPPWPGLRYRRVLVESPYAASTPEGREANITYLRRALRDCLKRGEAPFASHALYTQEGVLDDTVPEERALGIEAGLVWGRQADATVVYMDRGVSEGMKLGIERAKSEGRPVERRFLDVVPKRTDINAHCARCHAPIELIQCEPGVLGVDHRCSDL